MASLQVALDLMSLPEAVALGRKLDGVVDIIEAGTPLIIEYGLEAVRQLCAAAPRTRVLADVKIMDAGFAESDAAFRAGAHIVTVLGVAGDETVRQVVASAQHYEQRQVMSDLIECSDIAARARQLLNLGVHILCVHTAADRGPGSEGDLLAELYAVMGTCPGATVAVAGGVDSATGPAVAQAGAAIVVVGSAITKAPDPVQAATQLQQNLRGDT